MNKAKRRKLPPWLIAFVFSLFGASYSLGDCQAPQFRIGRTYENTGLRAMLNIAIRQEDLTPAKLICLAKALKTRYRAPEVSIGVFTSYKAALNYFPLGVEYPKDAVLWASKQHAEYYYNADEHEEYLLLMPDGLSLGVNSTFNTRIDFPLTGRHACKLAIRGRCLLEFDHIDMPSDAAPGTVTLTAKIERSGSISGVRILHPDTNSPNHQHALVAFAIQNLRSWRFEQANDTNTINITYSLERVDTPLRNGVDVQFSLPDRVRIQIGPLKVPR